eukprot:9433353-Pyramimonas_sp.AAC.1
MPIGPLDEVRKEHPSVTLAVCVDDLSLQRCGGCERVADELAAAGVMLKEELAKVDMVIALDKSRVLASSDPLQAALQRRL